MSLLLPGAVGRRWDLEHAPDVHDEHKSEQPEQWIAAHIPEELLHRFCAALISFGIVKIRSEAADLCAASWPSQLDDGATLA
jgi:hypothetical protein